MPEHDEHRGTTLLSPSLSVHHQRAGTLRHTLRLIVIALVTLPCPNLNLNPQPHHPPVQKMPDRAVLPEAVMRNLPVPPGAQFVGTTQIDVEGDPTEVTWFLLGQEWYLQTMGRRWRITGVCNNHGVDLLALQKTILGASDTSVKYSIGKAIVTMRSSSKTFGAKTENCFEIEQRIVQGAVTQIARGNQTMTVTIQNYSVGTMGTVLFSGKNASATISVEPAMDQTLAAAGE